MPREMPYSQAEFDNICRQVCPHCQHGIAVIQRPDTREWVHQQVWKDGRAVNGHTLCMAHYFRVNNG